MTDVYPTPVNWSDSYYEDLTGERDAATGIVCPPDAGPTTTPNVEIVVNRQHDQIVRPLQAACQGMVVAESSTEIGVFPIDYRLGDTDKHFAGATGQTIASDDTWSVYLDASNTLQISGSGFPADDTTYMPLAEVVMADGAIANDVITDKRPVRMYQVGSLPDVVDLIPSVELTVGTETGDTIEVTIQVNDAQGNANAHAFECHAILSDSAYGAETSTAPSGTVSFTTGTVTEEVTAKKSWWVNTDANGQAVLSIGEAGAATWYLNVSVDGRVYVSDAITFAA